MIRDIGPKLLIVLGFALGAALSGCTTVTVAGATVGAATTVAGASAAATTTAAGAAINMVR